MIFIILSLIILLFAGNYLYDVEQVKNETNRRKLHYDTTGRRLKHSSSSSKNK